MSQDIKKTRKPTKVTPPEVIVQEAVPLTPNKEKETPMERLASIPVSPHYIPDGMKSETRIALEQIARENAEHAVSQARHEIGDNLIKIGALAAGIGLGILICAKGYRYMYPVIEKTIENIVEETQ